MNLWLMEKNDGEESAIDMTPMLDIVFIMLIFFIVTTSFVSETGVDVNRPQATTAVSQKKNTILISITSEGNMWIDKRLVDPISLRANIERLKARQPESGVVIVADKDARTKFLVYAMDQIKQAGISKIAISAKKE